MLSATRRLADLDCRRELKTFSMNTSILSLVARLYLGLAGIGYLLTSLVLCQNGGSIFSLLLLVPGVLFMSFPFGLLQQCTDGAVGVIPSFWSNSAFIILASIGTLVFLSLSLIRKSPGWIYVLYGLCGISFATVLHNLVSISRVGDIMISVTNALLFLGATRVLHRTLKSRPPVTQ